MGFDWVVVVGVPVPSAGVSGLRGVVPAGVGVWDGGCGAGLGVGVEVPDGGGVVLLGCGFRPWVGVVRGWLGGAGLAGAGFRVVRGGGLWVSGVGLWSASGVVARRVRRGCGVGLRGRVLWDVAGVLGFESRTVLRHPGRVVGWVEGLGFGVGAVEGVGLVGGGLCYSVSLRVPSWWGSGLCCLGVGGSGLLVPVV